MKSQKYIGGVIDQESDDVEDLSVADFEDPYYGKLKVFGNGKAIVEAWAEASPSNLDVDFAEATMSVIVKMNKDDSGNSGNNSGKTDTVEKKNDKSVLCFDDNETLELYVGDTVDLDECVFYADPVAATDIKFESEDSAIAKVEDHTLKAVAKGSTTITVSADVKEEETTKASASTIHYYDAKKVKVNVKSSSSDSDSSDSDSSSSSSGGSSSSGSSSGSGTSTSPSGATVVSNTTTAADGSKATTTTITLGGEQMTSVSQVKTLADGSTQTLYTVSGDVSGLTFTGVGTVSADGATLTTPDGQTYPVSTAPMSIITAADGTTMGCFLDANGNPIATGTDMIYMQLGADGQMHAHFVNPAGFFYVGTVIMNGMSITFNEEGVMLSYTLIA